MRDFNETFDPSDDPILFPTGFGPKFGYFMVLNTQEHFRPRSNENNRGAIAHQSQDFMLSVGNPDGAFEVVRHAITIKPGFRTRIKVIPSQVVGAKNLRDLSIESRNCRYNVNIQQTLL